MSARWETYLKANKSFGQKRLTTFVQEYKINLERAYDAALIEDNMLLAFLIDEVIELKEEVKKLKKVTRKVIRDDE